MTIADLVVETLKSAGVKRVYGLPGDSFNGFTDALRRDGSIEWIHVRNEEVAAFAAGADAHLSCALAVCAASCGPGNLHLINGLFDCHRSRVPVLAIAAHIPSAEIGTTYFQETHPQNLFKECTDYCEMVGIPEQMPRDSGASGVWGVAGGEREGAGSSAADSGGGGDGGRSAGGGGEERGGGAGAAWVVRWDVSWCFARVGFRSRSEESDSVVAPFDFAQGFTPVLQRCSGQSGRPLRAGLLRHG
jgi:hypothetical protein